MHNWYGSILRTDLESQALAAAEKSDVIVFCGGISPRLEGEEMKIKTDGFAHGDRTHLNLPAIQEALLKKLHALGKPIVYVNFSGSAIALNWQNENLAAIVQAFYPGEPTGTALAGLLYGEYSPSGRLPITFYKSVDDLPPFGEYAMKGRTYRYFEGEVLYPFGYGLSYTNFDYTDLKVAASVEAGKDISVSVSITNNGQMDGREVVQLYLKDVEASVPVPNKTLVGFKNIDLKVGESQTVSFTVSPAQLSLIDGNFERVMEPGVFEFSFGAKDQIKGKTNLTGDKYAVVD